MSAILAVGLLTSTAVLPVCSWDRPGHNPFMGNIVEAVDRYKDIPQPVRQKLKSKMSRRQYDDIAEITKTSITGKFNYTDLRDMHFGPGTICKTVTTQKWLPKQTERGLVYCEESHCIIVPTVCRNVSRVTRVEKSTEPELIISTAAGPTSQTPQKEELPPLDFETAAGIPNNTVVTPQGQPEIQYNTFAQWNPTTTYIPKIIPSVPEPKNWILTVIGLVVIIISLRRKTNERVSTSFWAS